MVRRKEGEAEKIVLCSRHTTNEPKDANNVFTVRRENKETIY